MVADGGEPGLAPEDFPDQSAYAQLPPTPPKKKLSWNLPTGSRPTSAQQQQHQQQGTATPSPRPSSDHVELAAARKAALRELMEVLCEGMGRKLDHVPLTTQSVAAMLTQHFGDRLVMAVRETKAEAARAAKAAQEKALKEAEDKAAAALAEARSTSAEEARKAAAEAARLAAELEEAIKERKALQGKVAQQARDLKGGACEAEQLRSALSAAKTAQASAEKAAEKLKASAAKSGAESQRNGDEVKRLQHELEAVKAEAAKLGEEVKDAHRATARAKSDAGKAAGSLAGKESELAALNSQLAASKGELERLRRELAMAQAELGSAQATAVKLQARVAEAQAETAALQLQHARSSQELEQQVTAVTAQNKQLAAVCTQLLSAGHELQVLLADATGQQLQLAAELQASSTELATFRADAAQHLSGLCSEGRLLRDVLGSQVRSLAQAVLKADVSKARKVYEVELRHKLEVAQMMAAHEAQLDELRANQRTRTSSSPAVTVEPPPGSVLAELQQQLDEARRQQDADRADAERARAAAKSTAVAVQSLEQQLADANAVVTAEKAGNAQLTAELAEVKKTLSETRTSLFARRKEVETLDTRLKEAAAREARLVSEMEARLKDLTDEAQSLRREAEGKRVNDESVPGLFKLVTAIVDTYFGPRLVTDAAGAGNAGGSSMAETLAATESAFKAAAAASSQVAAASGGGLQDDTSHRQLAAVASALQVLHAPLGFNEDMVGYQLRPLSHGDILAAYDVYSRRRAEVFLRGADMAAARKRSTPETAARDPRLSEASVLRQALSEKLVQLEGGILLNALQLRGRGQQVDHASRILSGSVVTQMQSSPRLQSWPKKQAGEQNRPSTAGAIATSAEALAGSLLRSMAAERRQLARQVKMLSSGGGTSPRSAPASPGDMTPSITGQQRSPSPRMFSGAGSPAGSYHPSPLSSRQQQQYHSTAGVLAQDDVGAPPLPRLVHSMPGSTRGSVTGEGGRPGTATAAAAVVDDDVLAALDALGDSDLRKSRGLSGLRRGGGPADHHHHHQQPHMLDSSPPGVPGGSPRVHSLMFDATSVDRDANAVFFARTSSSAAAAALPERHKTWSEPNAPVSEPPVALYSYSSPGGAKAISAGGALSSTTTGGPLAMIAKRAAAGQPQQSGSGGSRPGTPGSAYLQQRSTTPRRQNKADAA